MPSSYEQWNWWVISVVIVGILINIISTAFWNLGVRKFEKWIEHVAEKRYAKQKEMEIRAAKMALDDRNFYTHLLVQVMLFLLMSLALVSGYFGLLVSLVSESGMRYAGLAFLLLSLILAISASRQFVYVARVFLLYTDKYAPAKEIEFGSVDGTKHSETMG